MKKMVICVLMLAFVAGSFLWAQDKAVTAPAGEAKIVAVDTPVDLDSVAVTVNGTAIKEAAVESQVQEMVQRMGQFQKVEADQIKMIRDRYRPQILDMLITDQLIDDDTTKRKIEVTKKDLDEVAEEMVQTVLDSKQITREELEKQIKDSQGITLEESLNKFKETDGFKKSVLMNKVVKKDFAKDLVVSADDVKTFYDDNLDSKFTQKEMVKASHILCATLDEKRQPKSDEDKAEAKKMIEKVQEELKKPDADFAALAQQYSECPSKTRGGDLGFFERHGAMVEPFAKAAYELKVGEVSDIVETQFGYHIIKVTEKKEAKVIPFDEAKKGIEAQLENDKRQGAIEKYIAMLKKTAKIEYPEGKEPKPQMPMGMGGMMAPPSK